MLARRPNRGARCQTPVIGEKFRAALLCLIVLSRDCNETSPRDLVQPLLFGPVAGGNDHAQFTFSLTYMTFKETADGKGTFALADWRTDTGDTSAVAILR